MKQTITTLALLSWSAIASALFLPAMGRAQCESGATLAAIETVRVSDFAACGGGGLTATTVLYRVVRRVSGPRLGATFVGFVQCPAMDLQPGERMWACIGESTLNARFFLFDDLEDDPRPRRSIRAVPAPQLRAIAPGRRPSATPVHPRRHKGLGVQLPTTPSTEIAFTLAAFSKLLCSRVSSARMAVPGRTTR